jgi:hypothetical protein
VVVLFTGQTGPKTEFGKNISRLNSLKDGSFSALLNGLKCDFCKRKEFCQYFKIGEKCTLRGEIAKKVLVDQLDVNDETKKLYELSVTNAIFDLAFNKKNADKWITQASRQLDRLVDLKAIEKATTTDQNFSIDFSEFRRRLEESKERNKN